MNSKSRILILGKGKGETLFPGTTGKEKIYLVTLLRMVRQTSFRTIAMGPLQWTCTTGKRLGSALNTDGQVGTDSKEQGGVSAWKMTKKKHQG